MYLKKGKNKWFIPNGETISQVIFNKNVNGIFPLLRYGHYVEGTGSVLQTSSIDVSGDICLCDNIKYVLNKLR